MHRRLKDIHKRRCCHGALQSRISHHLIPGAVLHNPIKISRCALCPCLPTRLSVYLSTAALGFCSNAGRDATIPFYIF